MCLHFAHTEGCQLNMWRRLGLWRRWFAPAVPPDTGTTMPPHVLPPPPGSPSAPSSTSRLRPLLIVARVILQVRWGMGHWFDCPLLHLGRDTVGTDRTVTAPETEGGRRNRRGQERGPMGWEEEARRGSLTVTPLSPFHRWTMRSWSVLSVASLSPSPETTWTSSTMDSTPPTTWEIAMVGEELPAAPPSGPTSLRGSQTPTPSSVPRRRTRTGPGLEPNEAARNPESQPAEHLKYSSKCE